MSHNLSESVSELGTEEAIFNALVHGCHTENVAAIASVSERTVYRRLADPEFRQRLEAARESLRESILAKLSDAAHDAIGVLSDLSTDAEDERTRLNAAKAILDALMAIHSLPPKTKQTVTIERNT